MISSHVRGTNFDRLAHYPTSAVERRDDGGGQFSCFTVLRYDGIGSS